MPGNNANAGTSSSAPKRDFTGFNINALPAGANLLFVRGGVWTSFSVALRNFNVTQASPLTFDAYGSGAAPWFKTTSGTAVNFTEWEDTTWEGGYTFRNLKFDGQGTGQWGFFLGGNVRHVTIEDTEIANFYIGIHSQNQSGTVTNLTVRNSNIHHNSEHGMLGSADSLLLEGNVIADNNMDGGGFEHGIYLSGGNNVTVRNNTFTNNSAPGGVCNGGNLTWHGQADGALIEGNTITQVAATGGCYGFSITAAYSSPEWFRNVIMRNNTVRNVGFCAFCMSSAPNVLIENNRIFNTQATYQVGVLIPAIPPGAGDDVDTGAIIRNNTVCYSQPASGSGVVGGSSMASAASIIGNSYRTGADASTGACAP